jgi:hypothetical protein
MTDTVGQQLVRIRKSIEDTGYMEKWVVVSTGECEKICQRTAELMEREAIKQGFKGLSQVAECCGKQTCLKFVDLVILRYEEQSYKRVVFDSAFV